MITIAQDIRDKDDIKNVSRYHGYDERLCIISTKLLSLGTDNKETIKVM